MSGTRRGGGGGGGSVAASAVTYYIDSVGGSDLNSGRTAALAFATPAALLLVVRSGDTVYHKRGSVFTTPVNLTGKVVNWLSYGSSPNPTAINGTVEMKHATWTNDAGADRWYTPIAPATIQTNNQINVRVKTTQWPDGICTYPVTAKASVDAVVANTVDAPEWFADNALDRIYIYSPVATSPAANTAYTSILVSKGGSTNIGLTVGGGFIEGIKVIGQKHGILLEGPGMLVDCQVDFLAGFGFSTPNDGIHSLVRCKGTDTGVGGASSGDHTFYLASNAFVGNSAADSIHLSAWASLGGNLYSIDLSARVQLPNTLDIPSRRHIPVAASLVAVNGPEKWFINPTTKILTAWLPDLPSTQANIYAYRRAQQTITMIDCEGYHPGSDTIQVGAATLPSSIYNIVGSELGRSRFEGGVANALDVKAGIINIEKSIFDCPTGSNNPTITLQGWTTDVLIRNSIIRYAGSGSVPLNIQEVAVRVTAFASWIWSRDNGGRGAVQSNFNGRRQSFAFCDIENDSGASTLIAFQALSGDIALQHCTMGGETSSSSARALNVRGNTSQSMNAFITAITCDTATTYTVGGVGYRKATLQLDGASRYVGPGARFRIMGLSGASAAYNGTWAALDFDPLDLTVPYPSRYAIDSGAHTRFYTDFYVPVSASPPATADLTGLFSRYFPRLVAFEGNTLGGKTTAGVVEIDGDVGTPVLTTFGVPFADVVPNALGANYFAQRSSLTERFLRLVKNDAQVDYTIAQLKAASPGSSGDAIFDTAGKIGGALNVTDIEATDVDEARTKVAISAIVIALDADEAYVTATAHGFTKGKIVKIFGVTTAAHLEAINGPRLVLRVVDANTFVVSVKRLTLKTTVTISSATATISVMPAASAGYQTAPTYTVFTGVTTDLLEEAIPASLRHFGAVQHL